MTVKVLKHSFKISLLMAAGFQDKVKIILAEKNTRKMTPYSEIKTQTSLFS